MREDIVDINGIKITDSGIDSVLQEIFLNIRNGVKTTVYTPNAEALSLCLKHEEILDVFKNADINIPDGVGVLFAAKLLGRSIKNGKVAGVDLGERIACEAAKCGYSLYLYGGADGVAEKAAERLNVKYPGVKIAGYHDGFSGSDDDIVSNINGSSADIVFVCLGMPKQEIWINRYKDKIKAKLFIGLGGSLDIYSGISKRAPDIFIKHKMEWLYRMAKEPRRIKRLIALPYMFCKFAINGYRMKTKKRR